MSIALVQSKTKANTNLDSGVTLDATPTAGNLLVAVVGWRATTAAPSILTGFTQVGSTIASANAFDCAYLAYRVVQAGDTATFSHSSTAGKEHVIVLSEWSGTWSSPFDVFASTVSDVATATASTTITPTTGRSALIIGGMVSTDNGGGTFTAGTGYTLLGQSYAPSGHPLTAAISRTIASSASYSPNATEDVTAADAFKIAIAAVFVEPSVPGFWIDFDRD